MRLSQRCYAVTGLAYSAPWSVNAGFIVGDHTTLIVDTGATALSTATIHGYATAARPANRLLAINTEQHFDHIGGNGWLRDRGIDVLGHQAIARTPQEFTAEMADFNAVIANPARRERGEERAFYQGTTLANPNRPIAHDTPLELGSCRVEILLTPGHTPTNLSVWAPEDRVLYCGDCLTSEYLPNLDAGTPADWPAWLQSLDRIAALAPQIVVCGHGSIATEPSILLETVRRVLQKAIVAGHSPTA